eukprot:RCo046176
MFAREGWRSGSAERDADRRVSRAYMSSAVSSAGLASEEVDGRAAGGEGAMGEESFAGARGGSTGALGLAVENAEPQRGGSGGLWFSSATVENSTVFAALCSSAQRSLLAVPSETYCEQACKSSPQSWAWVGIVSWMYPATRAATASFSALPPLAPEALSTGWMCSLLGTPRAASTALLRLSLEPTELVLMPPFAGARLRALHSLSSAVSAALGVVGSGDLGLPIPAPWGRSRAGSPIHTEPGTTSTSCSARRTIFSRPPRIFSCTAPGTFPMDTRHCRGTVSLGGSIRKACATTHDEPLSSPSHLIRAGSKITSLRLCWVAFCAASESSATRETEAGP